ncbi:ABC transporter permease [Desulfohalovibrio reitneri]|uniref:ABC transporter permease n=1 Tax=Desulfohalovibrio reitneri TaxID=1307759 RepID=UPI0004A736D7|nr:ABC transporter permease [Desulfohalovibrio reitneri]
MGDFVFVAEIAVRSSVAVLLAALGEIVAERSGVLNLGVEGMMLMGALCGFATGLATGSALLAVLAAAAAGTLMALLHALFSVGLRSNQVLSGLALTILGMGLSTFLGRPLIGDQGVRLTALDVPLLADIPVLGEILFRQNAFAYLAYLLIPVLWWVLFRSETGLKIRACGEGAAAADAAGVSVARVRTLCTAFGGALAGVAGASLSLAYTPGWKAGMTAGQGWIAIAMVIFAAWGPFRAFAGAVLFGLFTALQFYFQATGSDLIPPAVLRMLPYLLTIAVLVLVNTVSKRGGPPRDLGLPFSREG